MVVNPELSKFWQAAIRSGMLDADGLAYCLEGIAPERLTPRGLDRRLARQAVAIGRITPWQAQQLLLGRWKVLRIGKYELLRPIGSGGMGDVYLARDTTLDRKVAMKVLSGEQGRNPRAMARFDREARIAGQLQDEHLIRVFDFGDAAGARFLVMEYVDGESVSRLIEGHGALPPGAAAEVGLQVALGLEYLNLKGTLHRDVTPSNMLVDRGGTVKLADLGLAIDLDDAERLTREGSTIGTFDYLSPEQASNSRGIGIQSDLYSLGCSLYHMIAGQVPFPAPTLPEKLVAHRLTEPAPLSDLAPSCSPALDAVIRRMMHKAPEARYARPADVASALEPFASGSATLGRMVSMGGARTSASSPETVEAFIVQWLESDPEPELDEKPSAPVAHPATPEVFPVIYVEAGTATAGGSPGGPPPIGPGGRIGARRAEAKAQRPLAMIPGSLSRFVRRFAAGLGRRIGGRR
ncbi:serine/threonine-protein kinase [Tautonia plasticadhaerens]|uniref:Serine/threonine-protein kinase PknH n=1 Tax=Tautonia plasticadhaerens TaxID=2527974 RepID=A0A518HBI6_9BACT|nr:serine/threonine-protein kinase [Tautonia plasticadhaerens]QDV38228.1 Serine/threonine-protein kinase PknH [Tautonia plasticadhaerens]